MRSFEGWCVWPPRSDLTAGIQPPTSIPTSPTSTPTVLLTTVKQGTACLAVCFFPNSLKEKQAAGLDPGTKARLLQGRVI